MKIKTSRQALAELRKTMRRIDDSDGVYVYVRMSELAEVLEYVLKRLVAKDADDAFMNKMREHGPG